MAEAHPVGFQWVMEAKRKRRDGHPRRPALHPHLGGRRPARADPGRLRHRVPRRPVNHVLSNDLDFREYVVAYTNAADDHRRGLPGHRGPRRPVLRLRPRDRALRPEQLAVRPARTEAAAARASATPATRRPSSADQRAPAQSETHGLGRAAGRLASASATRRCSTRAASSRSSSGTSPATRPRWCRRSAASPPEQFAKVADALTAQQRPRAHHGALLRRRLDPPQRRRRRYIRTGAILQMLLGNIGRPGGGIMALRGHASIQGSTDIPTLFNILPGYLPMPHARPAPSRWTSRVQDDEGKAGFWGNIALLRRQPAQGLLGRRGDRRRTTSASTTCRG